MITSAIPARVLRHSASDALFVGLSAAHGAALLLAPSAALVAVGLWWNANTIAHNFIHRPFFRSRALNRAYSAYLTLVLGFPQTVWRERHLAHHAGRSTRIRLTREATIEVALVAGLWLTLLVVAPRGFLAVYLPGWLIGLGLCQLHGHYEHARGTTSHYGRLYNLLFFNDGYHVEHHERPGADWRALGRAGRRSSTPSRWPPVLRWLEGVSLNALERLVVRSSLLQRWVVAVHERAFRRILPPLAAVRRITIVGGGLFPRTALVVRRVLPGATVGIVERDRSHLDLARPFVDDDIELAFGSYDPEDRTEADLVVLPLGYDGDRRRIYERPPAPLVLVHDWLWSRRGEGVVVSWLLLKRLNLVRGSARRASSSS